MVHPLQERECRQLCDEQQWRVVAVENDFTSGNDADRPGWNRVLRMAEAEEIDVIVARSTDRISRSSDVRPMLDKLARDHGVGFATAEAGVRTSSEGAQILRLRTMFNDDGAERPTD
ncbi:resolvase-like protein [Promicromonospora sp. AC04]|nr:resolvase-like protein [Promicromonospora sp. AC04]